MFILVTQFFENKIATSFDHGVVTIITDEVMASGLPISIYDTIVVPDAEGWIEVSFEAPAEQFWMVLSAEKLGATTSTTAYIDDISLRKGWIQDRKCPQPESIFAKKGKYRFGFNGMEMDNEVKGYGNSLDFGARIYDSRSGRFLSVDRLTANQPSYSSYLFAGNKPIMCIDKNGDIEIVINEYTLNDQGRYVKTGIMDKNQAVLYTICSNGHFLGCIFQCYFDNWKANLNFVTSV